MRFEQWEGMSAHLCKRVKGFIGGCESECGLRRRAHHGSQNVGFDEWVCVYNEDNCFYYHSWRNNVVIAFGTLSSFLT